MRSELSLCFGDRRFTLIACSDRGFATEAKYVGNLKGQDACNRDRPPFFEWFITSVNLSLDTF